MDTSDSSLDVSLSDEEKLGILIQREIVQQAKWPRGSPDENPVRPNLNQLILETCEELKSPNILFSQAMRLLDCFLLKTMEKDVKLPSNLQLLGYACIALAAKSRKIKVDEKLLLSQVEEEAYEEVKAWEKLLLSELAWDVNLIIPQDYTDLLFPILDAGQKIRHMTEKKENLLQGSPLSSIKSRSPSPPADHNQHPADLDDKTVVKDANLIASLCSQCSKITTFNPPRMIGLCSTVIAMKLEPEYEELAKILRLDPKTVPEVLHQIHCHLDKILPVGSPFSSPSKAKTPSPTLCGGGISSPFKISSSSTPKSRNPLQETSPNVKKVYGSGEVARRRLSLSVVEDEVKNLQLHDKENNDSAIGMGLNVTPSLEDTKSSSSKSSSPGDSGASSSNSPHEQIDNATKKPDLNVGDQGSFLA